LTSAGRSSAGLRPQVHCAGTGEGLNLAFLAYRIDHCNNRIRVARRSRKSERRIQSAGRQSASQLTLIRDDASRAITSGASFNAMPDWLQNDGVCIDEKGLDNAVRTKIRSGARVDLLGIGTRPDHAGNGRGMNGAMPPNGITACLPWSWLPFDGGAYFVQRGRESNRPRRNLATNSSIRSPGPPRASTIAISSS
jgi:hypothetical protein